MRTPEIAIRRHGDLQVIAVDGLILRLKPDGWGWVICIQQVLVVLQHVPANADSFGALKAKHNL